MTRIARHNGTLMIGNREGFVPISATGVQASTTAELLSLAAKDKLPDPKEATATPVSPDNLTLQSPFDEYGKLWGIGLNYKDHAADLNEQHPDEPASFMKPRTTAVGPDGPIRLPSSEITDRVTAEAELGVVIGRTSQNLDQDEVIDAIAGYVPIIDMTAEDILEKNPRFLTRSKSFDSFLVFGPWITTLDSISNEQDITVQTTVNDTERASNQINQMMMPPKELVQFHSEVMTLQPGDVISTGTPGAHAIKPGDTVTANIQQLGSVTTPVVGPSR